MEYERIPVETFKNVFYDATELSSIAIGSTVVSFSDEFFAEAFNLIKVEPPQSLKGQFGPNGALYDGWETRRHNSDYDWCIIRLGTPGTIFGFDIDTTNFNGNEAPEASIQALLGDPNESPFKDDSRWVEILPKVSLGPSSKHLFTIPESATYNFVKLNMYPDGGIARLRVYGSVAAVSPKDATELYDLAHVFSGGRVQFISDQHFGIGANLINPGRGKDMGDGWETKRSRLPNHKDWVIIKLGEAGFLEQVEIDTAHFRGNFPESCEIHALYTIEAVDWEQKKGEDKDWTLVLPRVKLGPHRQHYFPLENVDGQQYTHVRVTIYPDGGIKRVRVMGRKALGEEGSFKLPALSASEPGTSATAALDFSGKERIIPVLPITPEAFAPFGKVVQGYEDHNAAPKGTKITTANAGTASKFHKLALLESSYPPESGATNGLSIFRCQPLKDIQGKLTPLSVMERHPYTNQAFVPMGPGSGEGIAEPGARYLVVVAQNGEDDQPDLKSLRAFIATAAQGIMYNTAVWHHPMSVLDRPMDFTCIETQIGDGSQADCEIVELDKSKERIRLRLP